MIICIAGDTADLSSVYVGWAARRAGHRVVLLDEEKLGGDWSFAFEDGLDGGVVEHAGTRLPFSELAGVFARFHPEPAIPSGLDLDPLAVERFRAERRAGLHQLLERVPCPVANRPSAGRTNGSKPLQMAMLERAGFRVPRWIVSNDAARACAFVAELDGPAVYKAVSGLRSRVRMFDNSALHRLESGTSPALIQAYIPGRDVRVHVVDGACHATEVSGIGVDYRFDGSRGYRPYAAPDAIAALCCSVAASERLLIAGFDFRVDPADEWHCLEVNPMPSFIPYQWATGQPIAEELLRAFAAHSRPARAVGA
jgi:glutathione synthase/RimK-type ligase-like ATP-grasp enzyme